ncbi:hypothetical protein PPYC1_21365 [Paenibacillus polymyxa]|nr:hypothetical protein PPYC1_21365 [Paenibacillus polymyxa]
MLNVKKQQQSRGWNGVVSALNVLYVGFAHLCHGKAPPEVILLNSYFLQEGNSKTMITLSR